MNINHPSSWLLPLYRRHRAAALYRRRYVACHLI